jgi:hypothetical protein
MGKRAVPFCSTAFTPMVHLLMANVNDPGSFDDLTAPSERLPEASSEPDPLQHLWDTWNEIRQDYEAQNSPLGRSPRALEIWVQYGCQSTRN